MLDMQWNKKSRPENLLARHKKDPSNEPNALALLGLFWSDPDSPDQRDAAAARLEKMALAIRSLNDATARPEEILRRLKKPAHASN